MKILAIIPARGGSKGIKNKNITDFYGKPLIYWTINAALKCKLIDKVVVSTDSLKIKKISEKIGAVVPFLRPKKISRDKSKTLDAIKYTVKRLEKEKNYFADYIVTLQPTSPLREEKHLNASIRKIISDKNADSLVSCVKVPHIFNPNSLMKLKGNYLKDYINSEKVLRRQEKKKIFARNGAAIYITRRSSIDAFIYGGNIIPYLMNHISSIDIDCKEDLKIALMYMKNLKQ